MLAAETYMNAQRCVDEGFADQLMSWENMFEAGVPNAMKAAQSSSAMKAASYMPEAICAKMEWGRTGPVTVFGKEIMPDEPYTPMMEMAARLEIGYRAKIIAEAYAL